MGYSRPHFRCTACGAVNEAPPGAAVKVPERFDMFKTEPAQAASESALDVPTSPPGEREVLLQGTDDEWDRNPYSVRGDVPTAKCPECGKPMHQGVTICKHCGADLLAREKTTRTFEPVNRVWENGWTLRNRIAAFAVLQAISVLISIAAISMGWSAGTVVSSGLVSAGLMAFLIGTFDTLFLTRSAKGKVILTHVWRFAFVARPPKTIRWREYEGVCIVTSDDVDPFEWMMAGFLFLYVVIPGILFWWYVIRPDNFDVALCKDHGLPAKIIFRTNNFERAQEIVITISDVAALPVVK